MSSDLHIFLSYRMFCHRVTQNLARCLKTPGLFSEELEMVLRQMETGNDLDKTVQQDRDCIIGTLNCFPIYERLLDLFLSPN